MNPTTPPSVEPAHLRHAFQALIHRFGLLEPGRTPCGQPLQVSQAHALMALLQSPGQRQGQLAASLGLSKSGASRLVDQLEAKGWVERRADDSDGRARAVHLSPAGDRLARQVDTTSLARFTALFDRVPAGDRAQVIAALHVLHSALAEPPTSGTPRHPTETPT